jgi:WD40 repeat protein
MRGKLAKKQVVRANAARLGLHDLLELTATATCEMTLDDHLGPVTSVALSPCGDYAATACADAVVRVWDLNGSRRSIRVGPDYGGSIHRTLLGHTRSVNCVAWSPDGGTLMSVGGGKTATALTEATRCDETLRLWRGVGATATEPASEGERCEVQYSDDAVPPRSLAGRKFTRGELHLAVDNAVGVVQVLPSALALADGDAEAKQRDARPGAVDSDARIMCATGPHVVPRTWVRKGATRIQVEALENFSQYGVGFDPVFNGTYTVTLATEDQALVALGAAEDLASIARWQLLGWDGKAESELERIMTQEEIEEAEAKAEREAERERKLAEEEEKARLKAEEDAKRKKKTKKEKKKKKKKKKVIPLPAPTGEDDGPAKPMKFGAYMDFPLSPYASAPITATLAAVKISVAKEAPVVVLRAHSTSVECCALSPDGQLMASGAADGSVELRGTADPRQRPATLEGHVCAVYSASFSADSSLLCTASADHSVLIWNLKLIVGGPSAADGEEGAAGTAGGGGGKEGDDEGGVEEGEGEEEEGEDAGKKSKQRSRWGRKGKKGKKGAKKKAEKKEQRKFKLKHSCPVRCCAFDPTNAGRVLSGGADGKLRLWRLDTAEVTATLSGHTNAVVCVAFSPVAAKSRLAVSGSTDGTLRVWDVSPTNAPRQLAVLDGHASYVLGCCFSLKCPPPLRRVEAAEAQAALDTATEVLRLASCGMDGSAKLWRLSVGLRAVDESSDPF